MSSSSPEDKTLSPDRPRSSHFHEFYVFLHSSPPASPPSDFSRQALCSVTLFFFSIILSSEPEPLNSQFHLEIGNFGKNFLYFALGFFDNTYDNSFCLWEINVTIILKPCTAGLRVASSEGRFIWAMGEESIMPAELLQASSCFH